MILGYHEIVSTPQSYSYAVTSAALDAHLEIVTGLQSQLENPDPRQIFTFDDGHVSNFTNAAPLLAKHKVCGIFFVIGSFVNKRSDYMTWNQLKELVSLGHEIQSHGWSHARLTECDETDLREELVRSRETLEHKLGVTVDAISLPHGRWNRKILDACSNSGYKRVFNSDPWLRPHDTCGVALAGRLIVDQSISNKKLKLLVEGNQKTVRSLRLNSLGKGVIKRALGDRLYHQLWCRLSGWKGPVRS